MKIGYPVEHNNQLPKFLVAIIILGIVAGILKSVVVGPGLISSVRNGDVNRAKELLDSGEDPNLTDWFEQTPLKEASRKGDIELMKLLLEHGADPNFRGGEYETSPLDCSITSGKAEAVQLLLDRGATIWLAEIAYASDINNATIEQIVRNAFTEKLRERIQASSNSTDGNSHREGN